MQENNDDISLREVPWDQVDQPTKDGRDREFMKKVRSGIPLADDDFILVGIPDWHPIMETPLAMFLRGDGRNGDIDEERKKILAAFKADGDRMERAMYDLPPNWCPPMRIPFEKEARDRKYSERLRAALLKVSDKDANDRSFINKVRTGLLKSVQNFFRSDEDRYREYVKKVREEKTMQENNDDDIYLMDTPWDEVDQPTKDERDSEFMKKVRSGIALGVDDFILVGIPDWHPIMETPLAMFLRGDGSNVYIDNIDNIDNGDMEWRKKLLDAMFDTPQDWVPTNKNFS